jgi:uncharacterized protein (TIGR02246 family)
MMRYAILIFIFLGTSSFSVAQNDAIDRKAIEAQIDAFITSWNKHDFSDMKNYIADDCDFVNVAGAHWKGIEEVQYAHQTFHQSVLKNTPMEKRSVTMRFLKPDIAIVHLLWHIGLITIPSVSPSRPGKPDGDNDDLATIVFVKRNGIWLITALENVVRNEELLKREPVQLRKEGKEFNPR